MVKPILTCGSAFTVEVPVTGGAVPEWVQLMPMGTSTPRNGTPPVVILENRAHADQVVAASAAYMGPNDMVIDYDHQTVHAAAVAGTAEAAGWVKELEVRDTGIWGRVEWTAEASAKLTSKRWRYISPYFAHRPDGRVTRIINAGLTNTPNLDLAAVASAMNDGASMKTISLLALASALGLGEDADEAGVLATIETLKAGTTVLTGLASALGAKQGDDLVALASASVAAAKANKPDPAKFVPVETVAELRAEMSAMEARLDAADVKEKAAMIAGAKAKGKLPPALETHANTLDMTALASFLDALPETGLGQAAVPGGKADGSNGALTVDELAVASAFGMTPEEFAANKKKEEAN